jgi:hypothetical protein
MACGKPSPPGGSEIYTGTEARSPLHKTTSNHTKKKTKTRQGGTNRPRKNKWIHPLHHENKNSRTTTTTYITTRSTFREQWLREEQANTHQTLQTPLTIIQVYIDAIKYQS